MRAMTVAIIAMIAGAAAGALAGAVAWFLLSGLGMAEPAVRRQACMGSLERLYQWLEKQPGEADLHSLVREWQRDQGPGACPECVGGEMAYAVNPWLRTVRDVRADSESETPAVVVYETRLRHGDFVSTPLRQREMAMYLDSRGNVRLWMGTAEAYWKTVAAMNTHPDKGSVREFKAFEKE